MVNDLGNTDDLELMPLGSSLYGAARSLDERTYRQGPKGRHRSPLRA